MKLISIISASALAIAMSGAAFAADKQDSTQNPANQPGASDTVKDGGATGDVTTRDRGGDAQKDQDYQAELKKCDSASNKQQCQDAAKKKHDQM